MTKSEEIFTKTEQLIASGSTKADAFKQLAEKYGQPVNSVRGAYYQHTRAKNGGGKPRRRETTPEDALADARAALERAIDNVDREVDVAKDRLSEAKAEYEDLKASAETRKQAISQKLEVLQ